MNDTTAHPNCQSEAPPHDVEAEKAVIGSVLLNPNVLDDIASIVGADDFLDEANQTLCRTLFAMRGEGTAIDVTLLVDRLKTAGNFDNVGGAAYLYRVSQSVPNAAHAVYYARTVKEKALRRRIENLGHETIGAARNGQALPKLIDQLRAGTDAIAAKVTPQLPRFAQLLTCRELIDLDLRSSYLVRGVLVRGQPAVIGGRSKTLKTSIATDLVVSLGSGADFLGQFRTERCSVAFWSGESGAPVLRETARRVAEAKSVNLAECTISWCFEVPKLTRHEHLEAMENTIEKQSIDVAVVDPLYLSLLTPETAGLASNLYAMGSALQPLGEIGQRTGCTMIVLHHFRRHGQGNDDEPPLEELSQSGVAEWARQWILLRRRTAYLSDGRHELYLWAGGSAGHAGHWAVDIDEGVLHPDTLDGRKWEVSLRSVAEAQQEARQHDQQRRDAERQSRIDEVREKILDTFIHFPDGATKTKIRDRIGRTRVFDDAWLEVCNCGDLEECKVRGANGQQYDGFKRVYRDDHEL